MTPERKEEIEFWYRVAEKGLLITYVHDLLAALEETQRRIVELSDDLTEASNEALRYEEEARTWEDRHSELYRSYTDQDRQLAEAQQTIARQQQKIDSALSWTWNCGEANMIEVIAALKGKEQIELTFPNCPICNGNKTIAHPSKVGTWLCVPCDKVFEEGAKES